MERTFALFSQSLNQPLAFKKLTEYFLFFKKGKPMKLLSRKQQLIETLFKVRNINGFTSDYLMHNIYELNSDYQREVIYSICCNLYHTEAALENLLLKYDQPINNRNYHPETFESVKYLNLHMPNVVTNFFEQHKDNDVLPHYRKVLCQ